MFLLSSKVKSPEMPRVLMYHMVSDHIPKARFNKMRVLPDEFAWQMDWLKKQGWHVLSTKDLIENWGKWPERSVVITFDDGYEDNLTNAFPKLRKHDFPFTIYLVVDRHDNDWATKKKSHHTGGELAREPKLSDEQVSEMLESGLLELGGHTISHANLLDIGSEEKKEEIELCSKNLTETFSVEVPTFCYPFGLYDEESIELVKKKPYMGAFTVEETLVDKQTDPFQIGRLKVSGKMSRSGFKRMMNTGSRKVF